MTNINLLQAMGRIDPKLIADAAPDVAQKKPANKTWVKWASIAVCFALMITAGMFIFPSAIENVSHDKYDNIYILGSIAVNMNGILWSFFIAPVFSVVSTFLMWLIGSGSIILPLWLIRDLCIPILHFCILKRCIKKNKIQKKSTLGMVIVLLLVTVAADSFVLECLILKGRLAVPHIIFRVIWAILCGLFVLGHTFIERFYRNNISCNIMVAVGSTIALCINAFMTYLLAPTLATKYAIDGIELLLMPLSIVILSVYSHLLGRIMTKRFIFVKLFSWLFGISASEFVTLWLLGTPRILPTKDKITTIIWIVVSAFVFIWCLIAVLRTHLEDINQFLTEKRKPMNRTCVKWASLAAACFVLVIAVTFITQYIPTEYNLNYSYVDANGREMFIADKNVWVYYVDNGDIERERIKLPCTVENVFITWKHLNSISGDVKLLEYKITSNGKEITSNFDGKEIANYEQGDYFVLNITVTKNLQSYEDCEALVDSLEKSMSDYSNIDFDEINVLFN